MNERIKLKKCYLVGGQHPWPIFHSISITSNFNFLLFEINCNHLRVAQQQTLLWMWYASDHFNEGRKTFQHKNSMLIRKTHTELNVSCNIETNENKLWFCFAWKMSILVVYTLLSRKLWGVSFVAHLKSTVLNARAQQVAQHFIVTFYCLHVFQHPRNLL